MAADEVDALAAPAADRAAADGQLRQARALDGVVVSLGADIADVQVLEGHARDGLIVLSAVVEVESVAGLAAEVQSADGQVTALGELPAIRAPLEVRRVFWVKGFDRQVLDSDDVMAAWVDARGDPETGALGAGQRP